jgi:hypothetical protein
MNYLISTVETYRVDTEAEVEQMINEAKNASVFSLTKYNCERKDVKEKGEVIGEYYKLTLTKSFNDIKDPFCNVNVYYEEKYGKI